MEITESKAGGIALLAIAGRLDTASAPQAEQRLLGALREGGAIADLAALRYVSSAGLRVLLKVARQARAAGRPFALCALQPPVQEVFEISGFDRMIAAYASRDEALAALA